MKTQKITSRGLYEAFQWWLLHRDPSAVVGMRKSTCACPLAVFLREWSPPPSGRGVSVGTYTTTFWFDLGHGRRCVQMIAFDWMIYFIKDVDNDTNYPDENRDYPIGTVRARDALRMLERNKRYANDSVADLAAINGKNVGL